LAVSDAPALVTVHLWGVPTSRVPSALLRMGLDRRRLRDAGGPAFAKLLGTGDGRTFTVRDADLVTRPDVRRVPFPAITVLRHPLRAVVDLESRTLWSRHGWPGGRPDQDAPPDHIDGDEVACRPAEDRHEVDVVEDRDVPVRGDWLAGDHRGGSRREAGGGCGYGCHRERGA